MTDVKKIDKAAVAVAVEEAAPKETMTSAFEEWEEAGNIGVDAGMCWVGDPCYVIHKDGDKKYEGVGKNWSEFCEKVYGAPDSHAVQFNFRGQSPGLGVCVSSGWGDGYYPVHVKREPKHGRIAALRVDFIPDDDPLAEAIEEAEERRNKMADDGKTLSPEEEEALADQDAEKLFDAEFDSFYTKMHIVQNMHATIIATTAMPFVVSELLKAEGPDKTVRRWEEFKESVESALAQKDEEVE